MTEPPGLKIVVLGGAGDMGSQTVEDLACSPGVERVTIADRNVAAAERLAAALRSQSAAVDVRPVDADDHAGLVQALRGYDVAASALGPFYRFETQLVRAAIEAGVDYASICDDWSATAEVLAQFDDAARQAGRTVLIGLGTSPGITNVGVRILSGRLDRLRRVDVSIFQPLNAGGGEAVLRHMLFVISGQVAVWRDGQMQMTPACSERRLVEFPRFGEITVWNMGHAEPVTVPRFFPEIETCNFYMGFGRGSSLFIGPARRGFFQRQRRVDAVVRLLGLFERLAAAQAPAPGAVRLDVWGERDGEAVHHLLCGVGVMRQATGASLAVGTLMLARKELLTTTGGVYAPEACIAPQAFVAALRARGIVAYEDLAMTKSFS